MNQTKGLIIGRFQIMHVTHYDILEWYSKQVDQVVIGLGSAQYDYRNPKPNDLRVKHCLTLQERIEILQGCFPKARVIPIYDKPTDKEWGYHVVEQIGNGDYLLTKKKDEIELFSPLTKIISWPYESQIRNGLVIDRMIFNEPFNHLLPDFCASYLNKINFYDRLRKLNEIDRKNYVTQTINAEELP